MGHEEDNGVAHGDSEAKSAAEPQFGATENFTILDDDILRAQSHKAELRRSFSVFASLGLAFGYDLIVTLASTLSAALYGLIYLGSTTAFNSIITSAILLLNLSYAIPQAILATRGREECMPKRALDLGRWGYLCNIFAPFWIAVVGVMVCFPPGLPVAVGSMNYTAPVLVGLFLLYSLFGSL